MTNSTGDAINVDTELYPALIQCFFIIGAGYVAGQLNLLTSTQSAGLSRFISNFALPAIIFKNLVDIQFQSVSWQFLASVMLTKAIIFFGTAIITAIGERPRNFTSMALYAIMTTQTNDFALIAPIIDAVFKQAHPDYQRYVYLIAPINLVILNPIGFFLIEIQNRLDDRKKHPEKSGINRWKLIRKILLNISLNPIVICTLLGVVFNRIFHEHLPDIIERILTPIAQSFNATALFYLGLTMVGKLRHLHAQLVITVLLLCMVKLILSPLLLRQIVFLLVKSTNGSINNTIDYSNLGFLYATAPTAPSVIIYVPESNVALQAIASTGLVVSTLLAGPIMLISAKMINLRTLDMKTMVAYETSLMKTVYDVSFISLFCTVIVLVGFFLRRRIIRISFIHKYTFLFVGLQLIHAIWAMAVQFVHYPIEDKDTIILNFGGSLTTLVTRSWSTSLAIVLMISICYSNERAQKYFWLYHLFGWGVPIAVTLLLYLPTLINRPKDRPVAQSGDYGTMQTIVLIVFLVLCLVITTTTLLRIIRRRYKLKHSINEDRRLSFTANEIQPLINNSDEIDQSQRTTSSTSTERELFEPNTQLLRHAVLVGVLNVNTFICILVLSWSLVVKDRDGIYYELAFLDAVLLHGQGIVTFLIFALDADLLLPISRKIKKLLRYFGLKTKFCRNNINRQTSQNDPIVNFEHRIRPDFIRHSISTQSMSSSIDTIETIFNGNDFCQWLVSTGHVENESKAQNYCEELVKKKHIVCINRAENSPHNWYAFSK